MQGFDVIVVGVGAMGSAACHQLAKRGANVLGLERFDIGHTLGSSGGQTRLIRKAYYEHPDYVPLIHRAYQLWEEAEAESGVKLLHKTGGLYVGPHNGELITGSLLAARQHNLPHESLNHSQALRRFPSLKVPSGYAALFEPDAGFILCELAVATLARLAVQRGATIRDNEPVLGWTTDTSGVTVRTEKGEYHSDRLIFAAGAWTDKLVQDLGVPLTVTRQVLGWVKPNIPSAFSYGSIPCWAIEHNGGLFYGFPMFEGDDTIKIGHHHRGPTVDPDTLDRAPRPEDESDIRPLLQTYMPDADGPLDRIRVCIYTYSPDGHFILDRHPSHENVSLACGFSGHGFKFAPVIGEALCDLALTGATQLPIGFLSLERFG